MNPKLTSKPRQPSTAHGHLAYVSLRRTQARRRTHHPPHPLRLPTSSIPIQANAASPPHQKIPHTRPSLSIFSPFPRRLFRPRAVVPGGECNGGPARVGGHFRGDADRLRADGGGGVAGGGPRLCQGAGGRAGQLGYRRISPWWRGRLRRKARGRRVRPHARGHTPRQWRRRRRCRLRRRGAHRPRLRHTARRRRARVHVLPQVRNPSADMLLTDDELNVELIKRVSVILWSSPSVI
jgi:hypothetical protein